MFTRNELYIGISVAIIIVGTCSISIYLMSNGIITNRTGALIMLITVLSVFVLAVILFMFYGDSEILGPLIISELNSNGFKLLDEKRLTIRESLNYLEYDPRPTILINGIPIERFGYKQKRYRMLKVQNEQNEIFWICGEITISWKNKVSLKIIKKFKDENYNSE